MLMIGSLIGYGKTKHGTQDHAPKKTNTVHLNISKTVKTHGSRGKKNTSPSAIRFPASVRIKDAFPIQVMPFFFGYGEKTRERRRTADAANKLWYSVPDGAWLPNGGDRQSSTLP